MDGSSQKTRLQVFFGVISFCRCAALANTSVSLPQHIFRYRIRPGEGSTVQWKWSPPAPGSLKALLFPPLLNKVQTKGTQGVQARYGAELPPFISIVQYPVVQSYWARTFLDIATCSQVIIAARGFCGESCLWCSAGVHMIFRIFFGSNHMPWESWPLELLVIVGRNKKAHTNRLVRMWFTTMVVNKPCFSLDSKERCSFPKGLASEAWQLYFSHRDSIAKLFCACFLFLKWVSHNSCTIRCKMGCHTNVPVWN